MSKYKSIYIDAGHGDKDPGAVGYHDGVITKEKDLNLGIALELKKILEENSFIVFMSRLGDTFMTPGARARDANSKKVDLTISIHHNSAENASATGTETLHYPLNQKGIELAQSVQDQMVKALGTRDRGIKPRDNLSLLSATKMTAILVEVIFVSNKEDVKKTQISNYFQIVAKAIYDGLVAVNK